MTVCCWQPVSREHGERDFKTGGREARLGRLMRMTKPTKIHLKRFISLPENKSKPPPSTDCDILTLEILYLRMNGCNLHR